MKLKKHYVHCAIAIAAYSAVACAVLLYAWLGVGIIYPGAEMEEAFDMAVFIWSIIALVLISCGFYLFFFFRQRAIANKECYAHYLSLKVRILYGGISVLITIVILIICCFLLPASTEYGTLLLQYIDSYALIIPLILFTGMHIPIFIWCKPRP